VDFKNCIEFANAKKVCSLATADGDQPRVRAMEMWYADKTGFYFQSQTVKAVYKQIEKNPKVELYFRDEKSGKVMRVYGLVKTINDPVIRARCIKERSVVKDFGITEADDPRLGVFQVYTGEAYFWTGADSMKEADIPRIKFG
jgi:uncharacterized pyridoxamine 5'-phosphate oxidase family protein